jgi:HSP20 family molecular chaperone IbpA
MDILDHFIRMQDSVLKKLNKSVTKLNKSFLKKYRKPSCEISQSKDFLNIKFGLPGMVKKDILLDITHEYLDIKSEKKGKSKGISMGYRRIIPLPPGLVTDKTNAKFSKEKLNIKIPKVKIGKIKIK